MTDDLDWLDPAVRPVSLDELNQRAALLTRVDRKYIVDRHRLERLIERVNNLAVLEIEGCRRFGYESVYFDTPDLTSYMGAAHRRRQRYKVRTRTYLHSQLSFLEVKTKGLRGATVKQRRNHNFLARRTLGHGGILFVGEIVGVEIAAAARPVLTTTYQRTTLADLAHCARITVDAKLVCTEAGGRKTGLVDRFVLETKSSGAPSRADRWLWSEGQRPEKISKYCTGLAVLRPELPSNKWHRTIARHFPPASDGRRDPLGRLS